MHPLTATAADTRGRRSLFTRTALCGALWGLGTMLPGVAFAQACDCVAPPPPPPVDTTLLVPTGGLAQVNTGGVLPQITTHVGNVDVVLHAPRTVIDWVTYNVGSDASVNYHFDANSWIVLNRVIGLEPSKIEGVITGKVGNDFGGNVWFVSNNSLIFGRNAQIDVGGFLAAVGTASLDTFLDPSNNLFSFSGGDAFPDARVMVLSGTKINGYGGPVMFTGPTIQTRANAVVTALNGGDVLYGSAATYQVRLAPGAGGNFDLVDFIVSSAANGATGTIAVDLGGDTAANSVFIAAVSKSTIGSAVINLEGMVTAQAVETDGGDIILSGGGGIASRRPGASLAGASNTDIYLNKSTASRDLQIQNVGRVIGHPWPRPPEALQDPPTLQQDQDALENPPPVSNGNGFGNGNGNGNGCFPNGCFAPLENVDLTGQVLDSLFNPGSISSISLGRDAKIAATASIELGRIVANRDVSVSGPSVTANSLIASGALTATASAGDVLLAGVGVSGVGAVTSQHGDVKIDAISAPQKLTVTAAHDIFLGDGSSTVAGVITLKADNNVMLDLGSAKIDTVTAGNTADLRGGALDIGSVTAPHLLAKAQSVKIGTATSSGDVYVVGTNGDAIVGQATSGDDVFVLATHGTASLGSATLTGASNDGVSVSFDGNPDAAGNGRLVRVESSDLDAKLGLGAGGVTGATAVTVKAGQDATVDVTAALPGTFQLTAARDAFLKAPSASLDAVSAGRDLSFATTTGDLTLTNPLVAVRNVSLSAGGALKVGDVRADQGSIALSGATVTAGAVSASDDLTLKATQGAVTTTSFHTGRDLILQGSSFNLGGSFNSATRDLSITSLGDFTFSTPLSAGRNLTLDVVGKATVGQTTAGGTLRIVAGDLDLTGTQTAANAQIESRNGALRVGGAAGGTGFVLDQTDFGQLRVSGVVKVYAGSTTGTARGDLTLQDLTINVANTPSVSFLVGSANNALVTGTVAPTATGGILRIGDATTLAWRPSSILVSGAIGTATFSGGQYSNVRAFDEAHLAARNDILMGSQRFITLVQGTAVSDIDTAAGKPAGVAPTTDELNHIFVATGKLEVSADNKVVQQNTSAFPGTQPVGVFFTGKFSPALIIDPPKTVQLWGAFAGQNGQVVTGQQAGTSVSFQVVDQNGNPATQPSGTQYTFNACNVGTQTCAPVAGGVTPGGTTGGGTTGGGTGGGGGGSFTDTGSANEFMSQTNAGVLAARDAPLGGPGAGAGAGSQTSNSNDSQTPDEAANNQVASDNVTTTPVVLNTAPPADADEIVTDPVTTGTGSEEIWRQRRLKK